MTRQTIEIVSDFCKSLPFASDKVSGSILYTASLPAWDDTGAPVGPGDMAKQFEHIFFRLQQLANRLFLLGGCFSAALSR